MAKPIRSTPTLKNEYAKIFIEDMLKTEKRSINKNEKKFCELISG